MDSFFSGIAAACWLGILTSISPCPLATNIAAISYIGKKVSKTRLVLLSGILYMFGRMIAYVSVGMVLIAGLLTVSRLSNFLQDNINKALGPLLVLAGLVLLGIIRINLNGSRIGRKAQSRADSWGVWGAFPIGFIFALSFCPVSAALFFGTLVPLSIKYESTLLLPSIYGVGTGIPVLVFALLAAVGARYVGKVFDRLIQIESWFRRLTGVIFILVGCYYSLIYIFHLNI